jgi:hypothetical protein
MKTLILILLSTTCFAQPVVKMEANTQGGEVGAGYAFGKVDFVIAKKFSILTYNPDVTSCMAGYAVSKTITAGAGVGYYQIKNPSIVDVAGDMIPLNELRPMFRIEAGKKVNIGRVYMAANYCKEFWFSIGIKAYLKFNYEKNNRNPAGKPRRVQ